MNYWLVLELSLERRNNPFHKICVWRRPFWTDNKARSMKLWINTTHVVLLFSTCSYNSLLWRDTSPQIAPHIWRLLHLMAAKVLGIRGCIAPIRSCLFQRSTYCTHEQRSDKFDKSLLDILVCPLSKERLRSVQKPSIYSKFRHVTHAHLQPVQIILVLQPPTPSGTHSTYRISNQFNSIVKQGNTTMCKAIQSNSSS